MAHADRDREAALALLGLAAGASPAQITSAYRRLARATHPDRCADPDATERFAALGDAYRSALGPAPQRSAAPEPPPRARAAGPRGRPAWAGGHDRSAPLVAGPARFVPWPRTDAAGGESS